MQMIPTFFPSEFATEGSDIRVSFRGGDKWAIVSVGRNYNKNGEWEVEPWNSSKTDEFLERCRYPLIDALTIALELVMKEMKG